MEMQKYLEAKEIIKGIEELDALRSSVEGVINSEGRKIVFRSDVPGFAEGRSVTLKDGELANEIFKSTVKLIDERLKYLNEKFRAI